MRSLFNVTKFSTDSSSCKRSLNFPNIETNIVPVPKTETKGIDFIKKFELNVTTYYKEFNVHLTFVRTAYDASAIIATNGVPGSPSSRRTFEEIAVVDGVESFLRRQVRKSYAGSRAAMPLPTNSPTTLISIRNSSAGCEPIRRVSSISATIF